MLTCDLWVSRMSQCCASLKVSHWATFFCSVMIQYWTPVLQQPRRCLLDLHVCNALPSPCATQTPRAEPPMPLSQTDADSWMPTLTKRDSNLPDLLWVSTTSVSEVEMENSVTATEVWLPSYDFKTSGQFITTIKKGQFTPKPSLWPISPKLLILGQLSL